MEKFSQFRDRGSGIAPFFPITTPTSTLAAPLRALLFLVRLPLFVGMAAAYFLVLQFLPLGSLLRKALLWLLLGIPGIWWIDLQIDGVKRGALGSQAHRVPAAGDVLVSTFTSPIDALYLAAIFDPLFVACWPSSRRVRPLSLWSAMRRALLPPEHEPAANSGGGALTDLRAVQRAHPGRVVVVFAEATTTNGKAILPLSPAVLAVRARTRLFPISLRYSPQDVTTPVPRAWGTFAWNLLARPTHCIRVRIAAAVTNESADDDDDYVGGDVTPSEKKVLDEIAEALARLTRVKRVGLTVKDKMAFVDAWWGLK